MEGDREAGVRENIGREGFRRLEKKDKKGPGSQRGREAGEKFRKESFCYLFTAYDPLKNINPLTFFDFHLTPPRLEQNFVCEKTKIRP